MSDSQPRHGGTLRLYGAADLDHLDPACAYHPPADQIIRLFARQLFTYRPEPDLRNWQAIAPVPDLAVDIPSTYNAGLGASHLCHIVHLRPGVLWDTTPPRAVTAHDVVRGFKRIGNPVARSPAITYFTSAIRGMAEFCDGYAAAVPERDPAAADLAAYQNAHEISGVFALDDETVVIELVRPALDIAHILARTCASPAPVEYDAFVPDSPEFRRNIRSTGPYRLARYVPGRHLRLEPNPVWRQESDPVRLQNLDGIEVTIEKVPPVQVSRQVGADRADLPWGSPVATASDVRPSDPGTGLGYALDPYLVFNLRSPNAGGALRRAEVRRAIAYAINKAAIADLVDELGTAAVTRIAGSIVPPGNDAHTGLDPFPTAGGRGDPERARALLTEAGSDDLTLTAIHPDTDAGPAIARSYAADLEKAGITVRLVALDNAEYHRLLGDPAAAAAGQWDIAATSRWPDWFHTNGRVFLQPMLQTDPSRGTGNYGGYRDPDVDRLIEQALDAIEPTRANEIWMDVERRVLQDAAVVPILFQTPAGTRLSGSRVRNAIAMPAFRHSVDLSTLWLDPPG